MSELLYRAAIRLYPPEFHRRHAGELLRTYRELRAELRGSPLRFHLRIASDLICSIAQENAAMLFANGLKRVVLLQSLLLVAVASLVCLVSYAVGQQVLRQGADQPQVQLAQDTSARLAAGGDGVLEHGSPVDPSRSLAPFVIIFDAQGHPLSSTASLGGKTPVPPEGVFERARQRGENRVTWQPQPGVRIAAVITSFHGVTSGFVLAGRSLAEVEASERNIGHLAFTGWLLLIALLGAGTLLLARTAREPGATA